MDAESWGTTMADHPNNVQAEADRYGDFNPHLRIGMNFGAGISRVGEYWENGQGWSCLKHGHNKQHS